MVERNKILEVFTASISGGGFPAQLQEILFYIEQKKIAFKDKTENIASYYTPDLCMGTSGGNVSLYIAISGNWSKGGITRVVESLNSNMFSQTWWPSPLSFIPTWVLGIFEGAVYKPGYGANGLLKAFNSSNSIDTIEMWNSSYNEDQKKTALFCNKSSYDTFVSPFTYSTFDSKSLPLKFLNGDINKISQAVIASASVPLLFKPVEIDGESYSDGGVTYPSPLTSLQDEIYKCIKGEVEPYDFEKTVSIYPIPVGTPEQISRLQTKRDRDILHLTYFSPYDIDSNKDTQSALGSGNLFSATLDSAAVKDRYTGINLLLRVKSESQNVKVVDSRTGLNNLSDLLLLYNDTHYFCEIYVRENNWIDLNTFKPQDVIDKMNEAIPNIEFLFFYVE
jgi:hypothetical protein